MMVQVKCLRVLQYFPVPDDPVTNKALDGVLKRIITGAAQPLDQSKKHLISQARVRAPKYSWAFCSG